MLPVRLRPFGLLSSMRSVAALTWIAALVLSPSVSRAHEGHDHGDSARAALTSSIYPRVTAQSELYELVGILKGDRLLIYLDRVATNEPVTDAKVKVTIGDGEAIDAAPAENGTYAVSSPRLTGTGSVEVIFAITANDFDDLLVGAMTLPKASAPAPVVSWNAGPTLSRWTASIPAPIRNPIVLTVMIFALGVLFGHLQRNGRVIPAIATGAAAVGVLVVLVAVALSQEAPDQAGNAARPSTDGPMSDAPRRLPDGTAFVAKSTQRLLDVRTVAAKPETATPAIGLIGRVIGDPNRTSVVQSVQGGRVVPLESGLPRVGQPVGKGDVLVKIDPYLPLADRTTISEKTGEIEQLIAVVETRLRRLRPLAEGNAVPRSQITDAETELEGLRRRREAIRNARTEPELLRAPTDGVIAVAKVVPGQVVQPQDTLFQIVDPKGVWVEALAYGEIDPTSLAGATAVTTGGQTMALNYQGFSRALQQHASIVHFVVSEPPGNLSIGQPVTVLATSGAPIEGLIIARDAVVRSSNGEAVVWVHVEPERFEPKPVRTQPFDATRVIVSAGLAEGDRIVVRGAELINQIR
jgi:cobalt-zinc-cadmium efflux system membrane fusion protein